MNKEIQKIVRDNLAELALELLEIDSANCGPRPDTLFNKIVEDLNAENGRGNGFVILRGAIQHACVYHVACLAV